jgi:hypothetical protein
MSVRYSINIIIVESKAPLMMMVSVVGVRMVGEEIIFESPPEMDEALLILDVIDCGDPRLPVRPQRTVLLLLEVLLQLQVVEGVGQVGACTPIGGVESGGVVGVVRLQLLLLIIHDCL